MCIMVEYMHHVCPIYCRIITTERKGRLEYNFNITRDYNEEEKKRIIFQTYTIPNLKLEQKNVF